MQLLFCDINQSLENAVIGRLVLSKMGALSDLKMSHFKDVLCLLELAYYDLISENR